MDDFADAAADRAQARAAERLNLDHQLGKLATWMREAGHADPRWRASAFASDFIAMATPEELAGLRDTLVRTVREWQAGIDVDDGQEREPVFVFAHGFRSRP